MVHVGVDLHKRVSQIAVLSTGGELTQHRLENDRGRVQRFFAQVPAPARVAIEASGTWWWLGIYWSSSGTSRSSRTRSRPGRLPPRG